MPTLAINPAQTYASAVLMACGPKIEYGTQGAQAKAADGRPKWEAQVAVTYLAEPGQRAQSEVVNVTITADQDPGAGLPAPCPAELVDLRVGWTAPEVRDGRARGGRPWYQASGIRAAQGVNGHRQPAKAEA